MGDSTFVQQLELVGIDLLNWGKESAVNLLNFIESEAPVVLQEWIDWNFIATLIVWVIGLLLFALPFIWYPKLYRWNKTLNFDVRGLPYFPVIIGQLLGLTLCIFWYDWIQILVAPRVWILENIKNLLG